MKRPNKRVSGGISRRQFVRQAAAGACVLAGACDGWSFAADAPGIVQDLRRAEQRLPLIQQPKLSDVEHLVIHRDRASYCAHPRHVVFQDFGGGELIVGHKHAPCAYQQPSDVSHGPTGYVGRCHVLLQRTFDSGSTWPADQNVTIYDETMPPERKREFLFSRPAGRESYDMFRPESVFFFGRTYLPERKDVAVCFALRSPDKGRTWEKNPTIIEHPDGPKLWVHKDCHPEVRMPDGKTLLGAMTVGRPGTVGVYASTDQGLSWRFLSRVAADGSGNGNFTYVGLLLLPNGDLQCYYLHVPNQAADYRVDGAKNAICMSASRDGGKTWTPPAPIVGKGGECWGALDRREGGSVLYRSPWPIRLRDGRILVVFARRRLPFGIGGTLSEDEGRTWSHEFVIRADNPSNHDLGYPVGGQLADGRIFIAYYYNEPGQETFYRAVRFLAGTRFRIA